MSALATSTNVTAAGPLGPAALRLELAIVERRLVEASGLGSAREGAVQRAVRHHLESGGGRTRAAIALVAGHALSMLPDDARAIAATSELLHNASLVHDDLQDRAFERRGAKSVWAAFGDNVAICAGDLLVSAAYSTLAGLSDAQLMPALTRITHAATMRVINGQAEDLALQNTAVGNFEQYKTVAGEKSGPLLGLPLELALASSGHAGAVPVARDAATLLAIAYQISDDLEDEISDSRGGQPACLNAVSVLRNARFTRPRRVACYEGMLALGRATQLAMSLPLDSGAALLTCIDAVSQKLRRRA